MSKPTKPTNENGGAATPPRSNRKPKALNRRSTRARLANQPTRRQKQNNALRVLWEDSEGQTRECVVFGREAQALRALKLAGARGITSLDMGGWAIRLASYIHDLRHVHGLPIHTEREKHLIGGIEGCHARYRLITQVQLQDL